MRKLIHGVLAPLLVICGIGNFVGGYAAAEYYAGQKLYGVLEGDWFFLFGVVGAAACFAVAADGVRRIFLRR